MFGAAGDGITDDTDAINKACEFLHQRGGGKLLFPKGVYLISKFKIYAKDFGYGAIQIYSNIKYVGEKGTVLRVADNVNKDGFAWQSVFIGRYKEETTNIVFDGICFDLNGENNKYPIENSLKYNACCAAIRTGYPRNITVENCEFKHCPGFNCLALGYADIATVRNCSFIDNADVVIGNSIRDHSCVLVAGNDVIIRNNTFVNKTRSLVATAIEVNSIGTLVEKNYVENFRVGCLVSPVGITAAKNILIKKNSFINNRIAFQIWHQGENVEVSHIDFHENLITISEPNIPADYAIDARTYVNYPVSNITISNNKITQVNNKTDSFYGGVLLGGKISDVKLKGNEIVGLSGAAITVLDAVKYVSIKNNLISDCCLSTNADANRYILLNAGESSISSEISIINNKMKSDASRRCIRGIWIINDSDGLVIKGNSFDGFQSYNEVDAALSKSRIIKQ